MNKINLHTHTKHSLDGIFGINEIINHSKELGLSYISITDHDNCDAYSEIDLTNNSKSGILIYGIEADAIINNTTYDILCYGFKLDKVSAWAKEQYGTIESRQTKIYNKLIEICNDLGLVLDESTPYDSKKEFAHAAVFRMINEVSKNKKFLEKYNILSINDFYRLSTMDANFPLYIDMNVVWPTVEVLSKIIHDNGGKIFLAHPYKYAKDISVNKILDSCTPYVDGIEICNEPKNIEEVNYLYEYAKINNLLVCAGSDYHGSGKHNNLQIDYLTDEMKKDIIKWIDDVPGKTEF